MEEWAEIRRLYLAERMSIKAIARKLHLARNTVRNAVRSVQPPRYVRAGSGSIVDAAEPQIRGLLKEFPDMPATVIAERIGWDRSLTVLKDRVRELRRCTRRPIRRRGRRMSRARWGSVICGSRRRRSHWGMVRWVRAGPRRRCWS